MSRSITPTSDEIFAYDFAKFLDTHVITHIPEAYNSHPRVFLYYKRVYLDWTFNSKNNSNIIFLPKVLENCDSSELRVIGRISGKYVLATFEDTLDISAANPSDVFDNLSDAIEAAVVRIG